MSALLQRTTAAEVCGHRRAALAKVNEGIDLLTRGYELISQGHKLAERAHANAPFHLRNRADEDAFRNLFRAFNPEGSAETYRRWLDAKTWSHLMQVTGLSNLMDKTAKDRFYDGLCEAVPEVTEDSIYDNLEHLAGQAHLIFQRGLARAFSELDRRFKSHDGFKIGSRMVLTHVFDETGHWNYHSRMGDTIEDIERVFAVLDGEQPNPGALKEAINESRGQRWGARQSCAETDYFRIRCFKNGNAHLWFTRDDLVRKANGVLAEYYGEVLPDAVDEDGSPEDLRSKTGALAKNLSFYPTPDAVMPGVLRDLHITEESRVLEPSAGVGHMVRPILAKGAAVDAIEVEPGRVLQLRGLCTLGRLNVTEANFLLVRPRPIYNFVVMNPPFHGTHWMQHVMHAFDFLAPGGTLVSVLPITAEFGETKKHEQFRAWAEEHRHSWHDLFRDLPPESFASSGTRVNTVVLTLVKGRAA